jgi:hypothetical protein
VRVRGRVKARSKAIARDMAWIRVSNRGRARAKSRIRVRVRVRAMAMPRTY